MSRGKDLLKNTGILMIGKISTQFVSFLLLPLYTYKLTSAEYGTLDLYTTVASILIPILTLQLEQGVFRFLITSEEKKETVVASASLYIVFAALVLTVGFIPTARLMHFEDATSIYGYYLTYMVYVVVVQLARGEGNNKLYAFASFLSSLLIIVFNIIFLVQFDIGVKGILISHIIAYCVTCIVVVLWLKTYRYWRISFFSKDCLFSLVKYSAPLVFNQISSWIINYSDRLIVVYFLGVSANGIYALANKFFSLLTTVFNIYNMAWTEAVAKSINDPDRNKYYQKIVNATIQIYMLGCIWVIAALGIAFKYLINNSYDEAYRYIPILVVAAVFSGLSATIGSIYIGHKKTTSIGVTTFGAAVVNLVVHLALISGIGLYAASISTLVAFVALFFYRIFGLRKIEPISIDYKTFIVTVPFLMVVWYLYLTKKLPCQFTAILVACVASVVILYLNMDVIKELLKHKKKA